MSIKTAFETNKLRSGFVSSQLRCSRIEAGLRSCEEIMVLGNGPTIPDMDVFAYPPTEGGRIVKTLYNLIDGVVGGPYSTVAWALKQFADNTLGFGPQTDNAFPTYGTPGWPDPITDDIRVTPWNPRAIYHLEPYNPLFYCAERWRIRLHGPQHGVLAHYPSQEYPPNDNTDVYDDAYMLGLTPSSTTELTIAHNSSMTIDVAGAPNTGECTVAIFWAGYDAGDF